MKNLAITQPSIETRPAQPYAGVRMHVPIPFGKYLGPAWAKVHAWIRGQGLKHGPAIIRYLTTDMPKGLDIDVGFVMDQPIPGGDGILTDILPPGRYATLLYTGSYRGKGVYKANVAIIEWAAASGVVWKTALREGVEWWDARVEWYITDPDTHPDPKDCQTELTFMVADEQ